MNLPRLILASGSPRRAEILNSIGWDFEVQPADIDESIFEGESAEAYVTRLALEKARTIAERNNGKLVLGADTTVVIDKEIIGKPVDFDDARSMLRELSGRTHIVLTGVALVKNQSYVSAVQSTFVKFAELNDAEIEYLVDFGSPLDKAGAYAVQTQAALFIEEIRGEYLNVVGLPVSLVYQLAKKFVK